MYVLPRKFKFPKSKNYSSYLFWPRMVAIRASVEEVRCLKLLRRPFLILDCYFLLSFFQFFTERSCLEFASTATKKKIETKNHESSFVFQKTQFIAILVFWFVVLVRVKVIFYFYFFFLDKSTHPQF